MTKPNEANGNGNGNGYRFGKVVNIATRALATQPVLLALVLLNGLLLLLVYWATSQMRDIVKLCIQHGAI